MYAIAAEVYQSIALDTDSSILRSRTEQQAHKQDTLSDDWIDDEQGLERELRKFVEGRQRTNAFNVRCGNTATGVSMSVEEREWQKGWQTCTEVLSRRDVSDRLGEGW